MDREDPGGGGRRDVGGCGGSQPVRGRKSRLRSGQKPKQTRRHTRSQPTWVETEPVTSSSDVGPDVRGEPGVSEVLRDEIDLGVPEDWEDWEDAETSPRATSSVRGGTTGATRASRTSDQNGTSSPLVQVVSSSSEHSRGRGHGSARGQGTSKGTSTRAATANRGRGRGKPKFKPGSKNRLAVPGLRRRFGVGRRAKPRATVASEDSEDSEFLNDAPLSGMSKAEKAKLKKGLTDYPGNIIVLKDNTALSQLLSRVDVRQAVKKDLNPYQWKDNRRSKTSRVDNFFDGDSPEELERLAAIRKPFRPGEGRDGISRTPSERAVHGGTGWYRDGNAEEGWGKDGPAPEHVDEGQHGPSPGVSGLPPVIALHSSNSESEDECPPPDPEATQLDQTHGQDLPPEDRSSFTHPEATQLDQTHGQDPPPEDRSSFPHPEDTQLDFPKVPYCGKGKGVGKKSKRTLHESENMQGPSTGPSSPTPSSKPPPREHDLLPLPCPSTESCPGVLEESMNETQLTVTEHPTESQSVIPPMTERFMINPLFNPSPIQEESDLDETLEDHGEHETSSSDESAMDASLHPRRQRRRKRRKRHGYGGYGSGKSSFDTRAENNPAPGQFLFSTQMPDEMGRLRSRQAGLAPRRCLSVGNCIPSHVQPSQPLPALALRRKREHSVELDDEEMHEISPGPEKRTRISKTFEPSSDETSSDKAPSVATTELARGGNETSTDLDTSNAHSASRDDRVFPDSVHHDRGNEPNVAPGTPVRDTSDSPPPAFRDISSHLEDAEVNPDSRSPNNSQGGASRASRAPASSEVVFHYRGQVNIEDEDEPRRVQPPSSAAAATQAESIPLPPGGARVPTAQSTYKYEPGKEMVDYRVEDEMALTESIENLGLPRDFLPPVDANYALIPGTRKNSLFFVTEDGKYMFQKNRVNFTRVKGCMCIYLRCQEQGAKRTGCKALARIYLNEPGNLVILGQPHNHGSRSEYVEVVGHVNRLINLVAEEKMLPIRDLFNRYVRELPVSVAARLDYGKLSE